MTAATRKSAPVKLLAVVGLGLALAGCGYSTGDRAASGGLIGAGAGATVGAVTGGNPLTGAVVGGAIGAVGGAVTRPEDVNLGKPVWR
jgi:osmotically inducible lipoprotein OsmB